MKHEWGKNVTRPLQYDQENWVSMVSITNLKIKTYKKRWQKKKKRREKRSPH
jgi:hypothetical protein